MPTNPDLRKFVPKCPDAIQGVGHRNGLTRKNCPHCQARDRYTRTIRYDQVKAGLREVDHSTNRGKKANPDLLKPVPKCKIKHASKKEINACPDCKRRGSYVSALIREEKRRGMDVGMVDTAPVAEYITTVLFPSGHTRDSIAAEAKVGKHIILDLLQGDTHRMMAWNAKAILSVQPYEYRRFGPRGMIAAYGTQRKLRGLCRQGWTCEYLAHLMGAVTASAVSQLARGTVVGTKEPREFVTRRIAEQVDVLVEKLGRFDIADLPEPMDGMSIRTARRSEKHGWKVLAEWDGVDIEDPRSLPSSDREHDDVPDDELPVLLIDDDLVRMALGRIPLASTGRPPADFTRAEEWHICRRGSELDHDGQPKIGAAELGEILGIAQRSVVRLRRDLADAERFLTGDGPNVAEAVAFAALVVNCGEWPAAFRLAVLADLFDRLPITRHRLCYLTVLRGHLPAPYGHGMSTAQLGALFSLDDDEMTSLIDRAILAQRQPAIRRGRQSTAPAAAAA